MRRLNSPQNGGLPVCNPSRKSHTVPVFYGHTFLERPLLLELMFLYLVCPTQDKKRFRLRLTFLTQGIRSVDMHAGS